MTEHQVRLVAWFAIIAILFGLVVLAIGNYFGIIDFSEILNGI